MVVTRVGSSSPSSKHVVPSNLKVFEEPEKVSKSISKKFIAIKFKLDYVGKSGTITKTSKRKQSEYASVKTKQKAKRVKSSANKGSNVLESFSTDRAYVLPHVVVQGIF